MSKKKIKLKNVETVSKREIKKVYRDTGKASEACMTTRWWIGDEESMHERVFPLVTSLRNQQSDRFKKSLLNANVYENEELQNLTLRFLPANESKRFSNRISLNVSKSAIDTLQSKIGSLKPKPYFLTKKGNWALKRKAEKASQYIEGCFQTEKAWQKTRKAFRDACIFGSGFVKVYSHEGRVKYQRVLESELIVDQMEAIYGQPRSLHQTAYIHREVLIAMFPDFKAKINAAKSYTNNTRNSQSTKTDMVEVIESWHLPSGEDAKDGVRCWTIDTATLLSAKWERNYFPFAKLDFSEPLVGYFGRGVPDELRGIQIEINKLIRATALAMHYVSGPQVWLEEQNRSLVTRITNEIGAVNYYKGQAPIFATQNAMPSEVYQQIERLYYRALEIVGVSQLSAGGKKPAGLDSKVALRTMQDIESERFRHVQQAFEEMHLDLAQMTIDETELLAKEDKSLKVKVGSKKEMAEISWKEIRLNLSEYMIQLWPTNLLPSEPEALFQRVQEMTEAGFFTKEEAMTLLDYPDIQGVTSMRTASRECVMRIISNIMDEKEYETPEPFINLRFAKVMGQFAYLQAKNEGAPTEVLTNLQTFQQDIEALIAKTMPPEPTQDQVSAAALAQLPPTAAQMPITPDLQGLGVPGQPPVSELMPMAM